MASDTCKIKICVEWHGDQVSREIEQEWWDILPAEEILYEIEHEIRSLDEE